MVKGDKEPMWGSTTEEDQRGYAATTLPFQSYGALGMARTEFEDDSASSQFFWLLFDSDLTPAGKNLLDGSYACFGYTVDGADFLKDVKEGDIIVNAAITAGKENLKQTYRRVESRLWSFVGAQTAVWYGDSDSFVGELYLLLVEKRAIQQRRSRALVTKTWEQPQLIVQILFSEWNRTGVVGVNRQHRHPACTEQSWVPMVFVASGYPERRVP